MNTATPQGLVVANFGQLAAVRTADNRLIRCHVQRRTGLVVCGDRVAYVEHDDHSYLVQERLERRNALTRLDRTGRLKPVAANLDQLAVVIAPRPEPDWVMVNAFFAYAFEHRLRPLLIVNKVDRLEPGNALMPISNIYAESVCRVAHISCRTGQSIDTLREGFRRHTSVLVGQSGVGKSSIVQALLPDQAVQIQAISETTGLGSHTTTTAMLYEVDGGDLIDSPGVREFNVTHLEPASIRMSFPELREYAPHCRFADCSHRHEPGCAVKAAVQNAKISEIRWQHYQALVQRYAGQ